MAALTLPADCGWDLGGVHPRDQQRHPWVRHRRIVCGERAAAVSGYPAYVSFAGAKAQELNQGDPPALPSQGTDTRLPIQTADGRDCQLPLRYRGTEINNCVVVAETFLCWAAGNDSTWAACSTESILAGPLPGSLGIGASSVPLLALPTVTRTTVDGDVCALPTVFEEEILDDCVQRQGQWGCVTGDGQWKECDVSASTPPTGADWHLSVANRTTTAGSRCLFPAVYK